MTVRPESPTATAVGLDTTPARSQNDDIFKVPRADFQADLLTSDAAKCFLILLRMERLLIAL